MDNASQVPLQFVAEQPQIRRQGRLKLPPVNLVKRVNSLEKKLPKTDADWYLFSSNESVETLCRKLTMSETAPAERAAMQWSELLIRFAQLSWTTHEQPLAELLLFAGCEAALRLGYIDRPSANSIMRKFLVVKNPHQTYRDDTLDKMRAAVRIGIKALTIMAWYRGARALALPCYDEVHCLSLFMVLHKQHLHELDRILWVDRAGSHHNTDLYIPSLLYGLRGGVCSDLSVSDLSSALGVEDYDPKDYVHELGLHDVSLDSVV